MPSNQHCLISVCRAESLGAVVLALGLIASCTTPPSHALTKDATATSATVATPSSSTTEPPPTTRDTLPDTPVTTAPLDAHWERSVVRIRVVSCAGVGTGSGFLIDGTTVITARHVVEDARTIQVETWDGKDLGVAEAQEAHTVDLGIIKLASPTDVPALEVSAVEPEPNDPVFAVGYPEGNELRTTEGSVIGYFDDVRYGSLGRIMRFTASIKPGNSGGPLLSAEGSVVGVVYAIDLRNEDSLAVPALTLRRLIEGEYRPTVVTPC
jgi:S1-C subfamily serine protease